MTVPDDFVFVCATETKEEIVASDVVKISVRIGESHPTPFITLNGSGYFVCILLDHGHDKETQFKKGTKEFNELLELAYMKQVLE